MEGPVTVWINVYGRVQGVGFRPFLCRLAEKLKLTGFVRNTGACVTIRVSGAAEAVRCLCREIQRAGPPARVDRLICRQIPYEACAGFAAVSSEREGERELIPADLGVCPECLEEMRDPQNRRYGYPYISCAQCGPRYTILRELPYDRENTSMGEFDLCEACGQEYAELQDRRCHGETLSCRHCGPQLQYRLKPEPQELLDDAVGRDPVSIACSLLRCGRIIMVKATGGFNLVCRADLKYTVSCLRELKKRTSKPFAVMVHDLAAAARLCYLSPAEKALLLSPARPIVLLARKEESGREISTNVTDVSDRLGLFLPSMGLYDRLTEERPLIVTSCNYGGEPILFREEEGLRFYEEHPEVEGFFTYPRKILRPADDSVTRCIDKKTQILRRGRGYLPEPAAGGLPEGQVLSVGAEMEPGFCLSRNGFLYPSIVPGDMTLEKTAACYEALVKDWLQLMQIRPQAVIGDLHPAYAGTRWGQVFAAATGVPFRQVQHHQAHALSVMAEHGLTGPVLAVCFDGTGYGTDGTVWGGEFLRCEGALFQRIGHVKSVGMLGGDLSMRQAWKTALCYLAAAGIEYPDPRLPIVKAALAGNINYIENSSVGRLFDAAAFLLGLADFNSHQGRCAMTLESAARRAIKKRLVPPELSFRREEQEKARHSGAVLVFDPEPLWGGLCQNGALFLKKGVSGRDTDAVMASGQAVSTGGGSKAFSPAALEAGGQEQIEAAALGFHRAVIRMVVEMAEAARLSRIVLSGGCFANELLLRGCEERLRQKGFRVYYNRQVPPGDGGIPLGQAYYGLLRLAENG